MLGAWKRDASLTQLKKLDKDKDPHKVANFVDGTLHNTSSPLRELDVSSPVAVKTSKSKSGPVNYPGVWQCTGILEDYEPDDPLNPVMPQLHTTHHVLAHDINPQDNFKRVRGLGAMGIGHDPRQQTKKRAGRYA